MRIRKVGRLSLSSGNSRSRNTEGERVGFGVLPLSQSR